MEDLPPLDSNNGSLIHPSPTFSFTDQTPAQTADNDPDSEPIVHKMDRVLDEEPLSARAKRLQAKKLSAHSKNALKQPPTPNPPANFLITKKNCYKSYFHTAPSPKKTA